jgi:8-oxo-dGTP pyrophosphatase MutT (NUDIX family)
MKIPPLRKNLKISTDVPITRQPMTSPKDYSTAATRAHSRSLTKDIQTSKHPNVHPRDASTLVILDQSGSEPAFLMGQRRPDLRFMPGKFVFPGGRVEPVDYVATLGSKMHATMISKLLRRVTRHQHSQRALALAHAALRETEEETGLVIGRGAHYDPNGDKAPPEFDDWSFLARAITPPRRPRRFDTRFFVVPSSRISGQKPISDGEFVSTTWMTLSEARQQDLAPITQIILSDLMSRLEAGGLDAPEAPVPFYFMRGACFHRTML